MVNHNYRTVLGSLLQYLAVKCLTNLNRNKSMRPLYFCKLLLWYWYWRTDHCHWLCYFNYWNNSLTECCVAPLWLFRIIEESTCRWKPHPDPNNTLIVPMFQRDNFVVVPQHKIAVTFLNSGRWMTTYLGKSLSSIYCGCLWHCCMCVSFPFGFVGEI